MQLDNKYFLLGLKKSDWRSHIERYYDGLTLTTIMKKELIIFGVGFILALTGIAIYESSLSPDIHIRIPRDNFANVCKRVAENSSDTLALACKIEKELTLRTANSAQLIQHHHERNAEE